MDGPEINKGDAHVAHQQRDPFYQSWSEMDTNEAHWLFDASSILSLGDLYWLINLRSLN